MHDHAARLVDDDDIGIFIKDIQRDIFRQDGDGLCRRNRKRHQFPCLQLIVGLAHSAAHFCLAGCNELLDMRAREFRLHAGQEHIETLPFPVCRILFAFLRHTSPIRFFLIFHAEYNCIDHARYAEDNGHIGDIEYRQIRKSKKSMTTPIRMRSIRFPMAPPSKATQP